jgi:hypothetical protein
MNIYDKNNNIMSCIIRSDYNKSLQNIPHNFLSNKDMNFQYGISNMTKGHRIPKHYHNKIKREIIGTSEMVIVREGKLIVDIYDNEQNLLSNHTLNKNDIIILIDGGHGFEMSEDTCIFNLKQGPYEDMFNDKTHF